MTPVQHATYAALSWSAAVFLAIILMSRVVRPRGQVPQGYWSFILKVALISGATIGLLVLVLGSGFIWEM